MVLISGFPSSPYGLVSFTISHLKTTCNKIFDFPLALVGGFGNYFLPVQVGAPDMAKYFPKNVSSVPGKVHKFSRSFHSYNISNTLNFQPIDNNLGSYLAGLIEGDGFISITKENRIILGITFNLKDKPLAEFLLKKIGKGTIVKRKTNSLELRFSAKKTIIAVIELINGKFRTPKIHQLCLLIDWINNKYNLNFEKLALDITPLSSNAWLAGFIEADGNFYIRYPLDKNLPSCRFSLEQRMVYPKTQESYFFILNNISSFLGAKLDVRNRENYKNSYYNIKVENQKSVKILIEYLDKFSLLSSKFLDYNNWKNSFVIILDKRHNTEEGKKIILENKNSMNDKRTYLNWEHLNKVELECRLL